MKLAIAQMVLGAIIALIFCPWAHQYLSFLRGVTSAWGVGVYSAWGSVVLNPAFIIPLLGLAVLGCGIAQLLKARK